MVEVVPRLGVTPMLIACKAAQELEVQGADTVLRCGPELPSPSFAQAGVGGQG